MKIKEIIIKLLSICLGLACGVGVTYWAGKYIIEGVAAERGYSAIGGEFILISLIFISIYASVSKGCERLLSDSVDLVSEEDC